MPPPVISFCLPTANRARDLDRCLASFHADAVHHGVLDRVEVCIADNCSGDDTAGTCDVWRARFPHFQYKRQDARRDVMTNLDDACHLATGEYLWLFGDDDSLISGVLGLAFEVCAQGPDLIHTGGFSFSRQGTLHGYTGVEGPRDVPVEPLFASDILQHGFITTLIIRREVWLKNPHFATRHPHEVATHLQIVADCLAGGRCTAIHTPCVLVEKTPSRNAVWNGYWAILHGYEMFKARARTFPPRPGETRGAYRHHPRIFARSFAILSLLRDQYGGIYELAAAVPPQTLFERLVVAVFGTAFASSAVRAGAVRLLDAASPGFKNKRKFLESLGMRQAN